MTKSQIEQAFIKELQSLHTVTAYIPIGSGVTVAEVKAALRRLWRRGVIRPSTAASEKTADQIIDQANWYLSEKRVKKEKLVFAVATPVRRKLSPNETSTRKRLTRKA